MFDLRSLTRPVVQAPMAGGPSTPELAAAVSSAGGLGFLAAGYRSPEEVEDQIRRTRALTDGPFGVNLFVPSGGPSPAEPIAEYARRLATDAARLGARLGEPRWDDDHWHAKVELLLDERPAVVSFTFGVASATQVRALHAAGVLVLATVTSAGEARTALSADVDGLVVQGPGAGGHRATFEPRTPPPTRPLPELLDRVLAVTGVPVLAAGGLATAEDVARVLARGAVAVQAGTAFLLAHEAGTNPVHRRALGGDHPGGTGVTLAFSGRHARGLVNDFMIRHDPVAPYGYPEIHHLTAPLRAAAVAAGDAQSTNLWAGTGHRQARAAPAADILRDLLPTG